MSMPTGLAGVLLWSDVGSLSGTVDGTPIGTWNDESGSGNSWSQATASSQPIYHTSVGGYPALTFDGVAMKMASNANTSPGTTRSFFAIIAGPSSTAANTIIGSAKSGAFQYRINANKQDILFEGYRDLGQSTSTLTAGTWYALIGTVDDVTAKALQFFRNGTADGSPTYTSSASATTPTATLGYNGATNGEYFASSLRTVAIFDHILSSAERSKIDSWAQDTYGITVSDYVPSGGGSASVSDSIPLATSATRSQSQSRSTADSISLSTATASQSTQVRTVADTLAASTSASSSQGQQRRSTAGSLGLSTLISRAASAVRSIADTLGLSSNATRSQTQRRSIADSVPLSTSTASTQATQARATSDRISLATSVAVRFTPANAPRNLTFRVGQPTPRWKVGQPTPSWTVGQPRPRWKVSEPN